MERISCTPRENYREIVEKQGFGFHESYWMEDACYCFTSAEIEALEKATAECYEMYCKAVEACLYDNRRLDALCIPAAVREAIVRSWEEDDYSLYGRFDFAFVNGVPKLLEFNADTPTSLVEAAVIQWLWKEDVFRRTTSSIPFMKNGGILEIYPRTLSMRPVLLCINFRLSGRQCHSGLYHFNGL